MSLEEGEDLEAKSGALAQILSRFATHRDDDQEIIRVRHHPPGKRYRAVDDEAGRRFVELPLYLDVIESPAANYRHRCRFQLLHDRGDGTGLAYAVWVKGMPSALGSPEDFPIASESVQRLMHAVLESFTQQPEATKALWTSCEAVHFQTTAAGDALIAFIYGAAIPDQHRWQREAAHCSEAWGCENILGRFKGGLVSIGATHVNETLRPAVPLPSPDKVQPREEAPPMERVASTARESRQPPEPEPAESHGADDTLEIVLRQPEGAFSNPNPYICERTMEWLASVLAEIKATMLQSQANTALDLLELYAGAGTYTPLIAHYAHHVASVEISTPLVEAARINLRRNGIPESKASVILAPVEACRKIIRTGQLRLPCSGDHEEVSPPSVSTDTLPKAVQSFNCVMLDPPRAGMDDFTRSCLHIYDHIILLSCAPLATFGKDLPVLTQTHTIVRAVALDHFPQTRHMEAGLYLRRTASTK